ncbi:hypothetical protein V8E36_009409 [Tilletia maclaganii]
MPPWAQQRYDQAGISSGSTGSSSNGSAGGSSGNSTHPSSSTTTLAAFSSSSAYPTGPAILAERSSAFVNGKPYTNGADRRSASRDTSSRQLSDNGEDEDDDDDDVDPIVEDAASTAGRSSAKLRKIAETPGRSSSASRLKAVTTSSNHATSSLAATAAAPAAKATTTAGKASSSAAAAASSRKRKRVSRACDQCWVRKDKCDGTSPSCSICSRLSRDCTYTRPEKKRGPQQGVRGRLEAQCAALECVLGWILHCAEQEHRSQGRDLDHASGSHRNHGSSASASVKPGTVTRMLLQPSSVASTAQGASAFAFPPSTAALSGFAQHWRKSVLATYLTSPLAPSSPGLPIGLEGAASVADGMDPDLAARQAAGEAGLLRTGDDTDLDSARLDGPNHDSPQGTDTAGDFKPRSNGRPPGKTRRVLEPPAPARKPAPNPAAAPPPVSRGPPRPKQPQPNGTYSAGATPDSAINESDANSPGDTRSLHTRGTSNIPPAAGSGSDVWARPTTDTSRNPQQVSSSSHTWSSAQQSRTAQATASPNIWNSASQSPRSGGEVATAPATPSLQSNRPNARWPGWQSSQRPTPATTTSQPPAPALRPLSQDPPRTAPATSTAPEPLQALQSNWSPSFATPAVSNYATPPVLPGILSLLALFNSVSSTSRDSYSFTDPTAQALLYALGLGTNGLNALIASSQAVSGLAPTAEGRAALGQSLFAANSAYNQARAPVPTSANQVANGPAPPQYSNNGAAAAAAAAAAATPRWDYSSNPDVGRDQTYQYQQGQRPVTALDASLQAQLQQAQLLQAQQPQVYPFQTFQSQKYQPQRLSYSGGATSASASTSPAGALPAAAGGIDGAQGVVSREGPAGSRKSVSGGSLDTSL